MSQVSERARTRPVPDEAPLYEEGGAPARSASALRMLGALSVLVVGVVHLEQYFAVHFNVVPVIGPLFALNFAGATAIGVGLLLPLRRLRPLLALGGMALAATSFAFLLISERRPLFGFEDYGYRTAIVVALAAEGAAVLFLGAYLAVRTRRA